MKLLKELLNEWYNSDVPEYVAAKKAYSRAESALKKAKQVGDLKEIKRAEKKLQAMGDDLEFIAATMRN